MRLIMEDQLESTSMGLIMEDQLEEDFGDEIDSVDKIPIGYKFLPTDEELVNHYLFNKVFCNSAVPVSLLQEIRASEFYSKHPKTLVKEKFSSSEEEREWFFFISKAKSFDDKERIRVVEDGLGFWQLKEEKSLLDQNGNLFGFKINFIYFSGSTSPIKRKKTKKTHWKMVEYRLPYTINNGKKRCKEEFWAVGKLTRGRDYKF